LLQTSLAQNLVAKYDTSEVTIINERMTNSQMMSVAQMAGLPQRQCEERNQRHARYAVGFKAIRRRPTESPALSPCNPR